jgi:hypothetical protein
MASVYTDPTVLTGLFKEVYGEQINLIPDNAKLQKLIPFVSREKQLGNKYHNNVIVTHEAGVSYAAPDAGAFALSDSISMYTQDAWVQGSQMVIRSAIGLDAAARASNNKKAFAAATSMIVESMSESMAKRLEIAMLYGQSAKGLGSGTSGADSSGVLITFDSGQWAPGFWAGAEKARVTVAVGSNYFGPYAISAVDFANKRIKVIPATETYGQDAMTGDITDIASKTIAAVHFAGSMSSVAHGQTGGGVAREMIGLEKMITTSGTIFGINNTTYSLWSGNSVTVTGQLTLGKILSALGKPIAKGLDEDVVCLVNPDTWSNLASDLSALRAFDGSYKSEKGEVGVKNLVYYSQNGKIEIISHSCVKNGDCFVLPVKRFKRVGATDVTFVNPGRSDEIFLNLPNHNGYELRCYADQALFPETLAKCLKISGFVNV